MNSDELSPSDKYVQTFMAARLDQIIQILANDEEDDTADSEIEDQISMQELKNYHEKQYTIFKQQRMPMLGQGAHTTHIQQEQHQ